MVILSTQCDWWGQTYSSYDCLQRAVTLLDKYMYCYTSKSLLYYPVSVILSTLCIVMSLCSSLQLFSVIPRHFMPGIKSPCWYEEFSGELSADLYKRNLFTQRSKSFKTVCDRLRTNFQQHLHHRDGKQFRLRCLPFFYIIGQPKCGTTDLFHRLLLHPEVKFNTMKEPHWWTRKRFGKSRGDGFVEVFPWFWQRSMEASWRIER